MTEIPFFDVVQHGDVTVLRLADSAYFDVPEYEAMRDRLLDFVEREQPRRVVVDFSSVQYCSTAVVASLLMVKNRVESQGGQIKLCGMNNTVRDAFRMLKLDGTLFDIHGVETAAIEAFH